ncbi:DNA helicase [Yeosuana aromativorans]|uniref:DNA 3'-5' helicase II n=1 Tax=Yeosuana aromativorans TaxID=288019 RepID=A0A8J3BN69_9FLAO|nr:UvrD-helicase domain-containing protein [Yeosuana aromativorans]GGK34505.1 DNA helicase [Yeosuana aromativorans]
MLPVITNSEIRYAEKILFGKIKVFDRERIDFIKNMDTIDLQAVPGSGKTTALLAKLLILEQHLPFSDNSGILVISHTNTAVDEIKEKIGKHCPKLFSYPNFVGTIQSFVDQFLAIPFYNKIRKKGHYRIDNEIYNERLEFFLQRCLTGQTFQTFNKVKHIYNSNPSLIYSYRYGFNENGHVRLVKTIGGDELEINKPRGNTRPQNYIDYTPEEKQQVITYLHELKKTILSTGVLCFDDAYFLAESYIKKIPEIKKIVQNRFKQVFVDEMQDMDSHQYNLLDKLFYSKCIKNHVFQRIGDKNQAIFSGNIKIDNVWSDREKMMKLTGSQRLSPQIANVVKHFGLNFIEMAGRNENRNIPPIMILFENNTKGQVLTRFIEVIEEYKNSGAFNDDKNPIKAIGWNSSHDTANKLGITDYHPNYSKVNVGQKLDYQNLISYLLNFDKTKKTLEPIRKNVLNAFLKVLRLENLQVEDRPYTKRKLLDHLRDNYFSIYEELNLNIYNWSMALINANSNGVRNNCATFFRKMLTDVFEKNQLLDVTNTFLNSADIELAHKAENNQEIANVFKLNNIEVELGSIHSVKGETHSATLYLETCYYQHETDKSKQQLLGRRIKANDGVRTKESAKMMYVGLSRPTILLCYAAHSGRVDDKMRQQLQDNGWRIVVL